VTNSDDGSIWIGALGRPEKQPQRYWVETQARDGGWSCCAPAPRQDKALFYRNWRNRFYILDADEAVRFMEAIITHARQSGIGIVGARVMQIDPEGRENIYHTGIVEAQS